VKALGLEGIGVEFDRKASRWTTTADDPKTLYAAGDITGAYQFTHAAGYEGGIV